MRMLMPISLLLIVIGLSGYAASCFGTAVFDDSHTDTIAAQLEAPTDAVANQSDRPSGPIGLATLAGLTFAAGIVCFAIALFGRRSGTFEERPGDQQSPSARSERPPHRV
jgi:hypothetical protein